MPERAYDPMAAMDEFAKFVELVTGWKRQFIDAGWSDAAAEELVITQLKNIKAAS